MWSSSANRAGKSKYARAAAPLLLLALSLSLLISGTVRAATAPSLGTAQSFAVLGGSTVTNTGPSIVNGDLGVSPGGAVTGFPPGIVTGGTIHVADAVALQAQNDVTTAYNALAGQACDATLTGQDLGGMTLLPGVYCYASSAQLTGTLTLDAQGNADAVFIFKIGSTLTTASGAMVRVINGAAPCNVYWQVGSSATLGTTTTFAGNILALASITLTTGASVSGRALARTAAVTMDTNTVSFAACASAPVTTTPGTTTPVTTTPGTPTTTPRPAPPESAPPEPTTAPTTPTHVPPTATPTSIPPAAPPSPPIPVPLTGGTIGGIVTDAATGQPLPATTVTITAANGNPVASLTSDANGTYRSGALPGGRYTVTATRPGYNPGIPTAVSVVDGQATLTDLTLTGAAAIPQLPNTGAGGAGPERIAGVAAILLALLVASAGLGRWRAPEPVVRIRPSGSRSA